MTQSLENKRVAILATNGFEQSELFHPLNALKDANVKVDIISLEKGSIKGWDEDNWGESIEVDLTLQEAKSEEYDALVLPGGLFNPDTLRTSDAAIAFIKDFFADEKQRPVAAVCHGAQSVNDCVLSSPLSKKPHLMWLSSFLTVVFAPTTWAGFTRLFRAARFVMRLIVAESS